MDVVRPEFAPDPTLSREEMEALQVELADEAVFTDDLPFDPDTLTVGNDAPARGDDWPVRDGGDESQQQTLAGTSEEETDGRPLVAGVDQAFVGDLAVSAIAVFRDGRVLERVHAVEPTEIPYIPGLLSFREGGAILSAFAELDCDPDLALVDGSGRIHFREAGIATHIGVMLDLPTVGVAKSLLCGTPRESLDRKFPEGARVPIEADAKVETADPGTLIGYAFQSRQFESGTRSINPLIVSPGHRVSADTAADLVEQCCAGYKLPEPTRVADSDADELKTEISE